jgi:hypothetical protein
MASNFLVNVNGILTDIQSLISTKTATTVQISTNNPTNTQYNVVFNRRVAIRTNDISVGVNGYCLNGPQVYTFGPSQRPIWLSTPECTDITFSLLTSTNGSTWYTVPNLTFTTTWGISYNGRIWVAASISSYTNGNTLSYSWDG